MRINYKYSIALTDEQWGTVCEALTRGWKKDAVTNEQQEIAEKIRKAHMKEREKSSASDDVLPSNSPTGMKYQALSNGITEAIHISTNSACELGDIIDALNAKNISTKFE